jgi:NAD(P)-dependent dehydrogenase (short-subunit alcohol dehydrogenase family)
MWISHGIAPNLITRGLKFAIDLAQDSDYGTTTDVMPSIIGKRQPPRRTKVTTSTLHTRLAIVTGATGGMGSACAHRFAADGWSMILCDLHEARLRTLAAPLHAPGLQIDLLAADVASAEFPARLAQIIGDRPIGAVVHTAGLSPTMGSPEQIMGVNYDASVRLVTLIRDRMARGSCAVLIASSAGHSTTQPDILAAIEAIPDGGDGTSLLPFASGSSGYSYSISKRAVQRLVERQAMAFGKQGARIMSISPGLIDTPMGRAEQKAHPQMDQMLAVTPLGRYGTSDEIARVALFLCSSGASFLSGSDIKVDGGVLAAMSVVSAPS